jgi:hypothetical protein
MQVRLATSVARRVLGLFVKELERRVLEVGISPFKGEDPSYDGQFVPFDIKYMRPNIVVLIYPSNEPGWG